MFIVLLKFSTNKDHAPQYMDGHKQWIKQGFEDGVFLMSGSIQPSVGGGLIAHDISFPELEMRVNEDPFVAEDIVNAEIIEISPAKADERLAFLLS